MWVMKGRWEAAWLSEEWGGRPGGGKYGPRTSHTEPPRAMEGSGHTFLSEREKFRVFALYKLGQETLISH